MLSYLKSYRGLTRDEGFSSKMARELLWQTFKMKYFPYRLYTLDPECFRNETGGLIYQTRTWNWRGRVLHTKEYS